ncbi:polysialic acid transport ATP-binding protein KpsT [Agarivorans sp. OAG1]|uniref:ABC transporter ATP-binding protein n=1 Tax=Agarivorans sp. OAG1 TaxID=3082387 RepID=UPI002B2A0C28|nr:polysialic acid transport ATP-binding protein KpsT [Agarivorans sp. OAG1]
MAVSSIELLNVTKWYPSKLGRRYVLNNVSLRLPKGRDIAIMGANGAGKSTLLRMLGRTDFPNRGTINNPFKTSWPLGLSGGTQGSMSGRENTQFVCRIYGVKRSEVIEAFVQEFSGIGDNFELPVKSYSSGMRSKFSFALSMAFDFEVYLIDEVLAVGDQSFQRKCREALEEKRELANILLVAHSAKKMKQHCDYGLVIHQGKISTYEDIDEAIHIYKRL